MFSFSASRVTSSLLRSTKTTMTASRFSRPSLQQQFRTMFIQTEDTPNPESLKFLPGRPVMDNKNSQSENNDDNRGFYVTKKDVSDVARSPLAKALFAVDGIKSVYLGNDFVTVTKFAETPWVHVKTRIFSALMDFYASGQPALLEHAEITDTTIFDDDDEVVAMIKELLESRIRPAVQEDGGDIRYVGFEPETGIVTVQLAGSCVGCPSSSVTLKQGVENMLMHYIPEVTAVVSKEEDEDDEDAPPTASSSSDGGVEVTKSSSSSSSSSQKTYEERLAAAGIPFSD